METQFTDQHIQVENGNDIFENGTPRQLVRRRFAGRGVIWFKKPPSNNQTLDPVDDIDAAECLEECWASQKGYAPAKVMIPEVFY
jgi:hypothetical protein